MVASNNSSKIPSQIVKAPYRSPLISSGKQSLLPVQVESPQFGFDGQYRREIY